MDTVSLHFKVNIPENKSRQGKRTEVSIISIGKYHSDFPILFYQSSPGGIIGSLRERY